MLKILNCFFSLCLLTAYSGYAQTQDSVQQAQPERLRSEWVPSALRLGLTISDLVNTLISPDATAYGFQLELPVRQLMLNLDYGQASLALSNVQAEVPERNFTYSSSGSFLRAGVDINLLKDRKTNSNDAFADVIYFGLKYAHSRLSDQLSFLPEDSVYQTSQINSSNNNLNAWWLEMSAGVKVEVLNNIFLGYALRYKFLKQFDDAGSLLPYRVPGFGPGNNNSAFGFDYYIYYRIPFRKKE